jgi:hypothetical protein
MDRLARLQAIVAPLMFHEYRGPAWRVASTRAFDARYRAWVVD